MKKNFTDLEENKINKRRKYCSYMKDKIKLEALLLLQVSELSLQKWKELICQNDTYHCKLHPYSHHLYLRTTLYFIRRLKTEAKLKDQKLKLFDEMLHWITKK